MKPHKYILWANTELLIVKVGGTRSYHWALMELYHRSGITNQLSEFLHC
jgi:hypothetical protein